MRVDTSNESPSSQLSFGVSTSIWLFSCEKHVTVKVVLKTEAAENRSSDSTTSSVDFDPTSRFRPHETGEPAVHGVAWNAD
jgi:hypothetical protein